MFALMVRLGEQMNVPEGKIEAFEQDGWVVVEKFYSVQPPENVQTPEGAATPAEAVEKVSKRKTKKDAE